MITKHFFKTLFIFSLMIALGLFGVYLLGHFDQDSNQTATTPTCNDGDLC